MRFVSLPTGAALAAHALAWAAAVFFTFAPTYSSGRTAIEVNGPGVIFLFLVPVVLTGIALIAIRFATNTEEKRRAALIWVPTVALLGFCVLAALSIGLFYLPAALALLTAAIADCRTQDSTGEA